MDDAISRSALVAQFDEMCLEDCSYCPWYVYDDPCGDGHCGLIEKAPALDVAPVVQQPKWISVKERLPEPKKEVLICIRYNTGNVIRETAKYDEEHGDPWLTSNEDYYCSVWDPEVTHWMSLPEPPEVNT